MPCLCLGHNLTSPKFIFPTLRTNRELFGEKRIGGRIRVSPSTPSRHFESRDGKRKDSCKKIQRRVVGFDIESQRSSDESSRCEVETGLAVPWLRR